MRCPGAAGDSLTRCARRAVWCLWSSRALFARVREEVLTLSFLSIAIIALTIMGWVSPWILLIFPVVALVLVLAFLEDRWSDRAAQKARERAPWRELP